MISIETSKLEKLTESLLKSADIFVWEDDDSAHVRMLKQQGINNIIIGQLVFGLVERLDELKDRVEK